ncbi:MAG: flagellar export protein FliJ [Aeromonadaceae bacterium]
MSKAIELLIERLLEAEDRAARAMSMARQDQQRYEAQLEALNQYRENYSGQLTERGSLGLTSFQFGHYQAFINKLDHAAQQQLQGLRQVRQVTEKRRLEWLEIQQQRKALETLQSRKAAKEALKAARQEQKLLDEFATFRYFHRQAES